MRILPLYERISSPVGEGVSFDALLFECMRGGKVTALCGTLRKRWKGEVAMPDDQDLLARSLRWLTGLLRPRVLRDQDDLFANLPASPCSQSQSSGKL